MLTFRTSITLALTAFVVALGTLLTVIQTRALRLATQDAASAYMDATSTKAFGRLQTEVTAIASLVHVLATSSSIADSNERTESGRARCRPECGWNSVWRNLRQHEGIVSGCEVNWLSDGFGGERLPAINLAHVDLAGGKQRPEQHGGSVC
jgi:adenylate cyclase